MFFLPILFFWVLILLLANRVWRARLKYGPGSIGRKVLAVLAGLLVAFIAWWILVLATPDSLW